MGALTFNAQSHTLECMEIVIFTDDNAWIGFARYAGAYRIATELRQAGYSVKVIDFFSSYTYEQIIEILDLYVDRSTLFVGFATSLWVRNSDYDFKEYAANSYEAHLKSLFPHSEKYMNLFFQHARQINPNVKFVVGGSKAESLGSDWIDHWVIGQGEAAVLDLALKLKRKQYDQIPKIIEGKKFDYQGFASSAIEWTDEDHIFKGECLPIEIARGCIFRCSFCYYPMNGKKKNEYVKSKEHLKKELIQAHEKYGTETFLFTDDLVNDTLEKVRMLSTLAQELPFKLEWSGYCRLDLIYAYPEMAELLLKAGIRSAYFGIETLNKEAGLKSGKGLGKEKILKTLEHVKSVWGEEVMINAGFIVGLPGEPKSSVQNTLDWLLTDDCPIDVADVGVLNIKARDYLPELAVYNSRIGENPDQFGMKVSRYKWEHELMNSDEASQLVYDFYSNPAFLKKKRGAPLTMYPRLKNLGYSFKEITQLSLGDKGFKEKALLRRKELFEEYHSKLLNQPKLQLDLAGL